MASVTPSADLLRAVRAGFIQQGSSLTKWCEENEIARQWATAALLGTRDGPAARELRNRLAEASLGEIAA